MKQLNVRIDEKLYNELKKYCKEDYFFKTSYQFIVKRAIEEFLINHKRNK